MRNKLEFIRSAVIPKRVAVFVLLFMLPAIPGAAQARAALSGTVVDDTGAVIPNASVTATNEQTQQIYSAKTGSSGNYRILDLPIGKYTVKASVTGFKSAQKTGVEVLPGESSELNFTIPIGDGPVGEIDVKVVTSSGSPIPEASIVVSAVATGTTWNGSSDSNGEYRFQELQCVDYDIQVSTQNGKHATRHIHVNAGAPQITRIVPK